MLTDRRYIRRRILIVSSSQDSANSLATILRAEGHYVAIADDGQSALEWNLDFRPDIVLLDLRLAGTDAYALAQAMRAQPNRESVTLVCVTGWLPEADAPVGWKEAGFSYHLEVPADEGDLEVMFGLLGIPEDRSWTENRYSSRRILIVEHDREAAQSLAAPLRKMGNQVEIVHDGCDALEAERSFRPDIVLIDLRLLGMDACTLARSIRAQPSIRKVSLVFLRSAGFGVEDWKRAREAGFDSSMTISADLIDLQRMLVAVGAATETAADVANNATRLYNKGAFTTQEFIFRLIQRAAKHDPAEMVTAIGDIWDASSCGQTLEEFLEEMRTYATEPPSDPSQISESWWRGLGSKTEGEDMQMLRQNAYEGWWRWYRYFRG
jgi:DNA-binding response OmpR family regulator